MSKLISKSEAVKAINSADALEILVETIDRSETASSKQTKAKRFINDIQAQLKDQRTVVLLSVKVK